MFNFLEKREKITKINLGVLCSVSGTKSVTCPRGASPLPTIYINV